MSMANGAAPEHSHHRWDDLPIEAKVAHHHELLGEAPNDAARTPGTGIQGAFAAHLREHERVAAKQEGAAEETTRTMKRLRYVGLMVGASAALVGYRPLTDLLSFLVHR